MNFSSSQFINSNLLFSPNDHRPESFNFLCESNMPYTVKGRSNTLSKGRQIEFLKDWKSEPLVENAL